MPAPNPRRTIGEHEYELELWPTSQALEWEHLLMQLGLEPAAMMMSESEPGAPIDESQFVALARSLAAKLEKHRIDKLMKDLMSGVSIVGTFEGKPMRKAVADKATWDNHFRGRLKDLHELAWWVLAENFSDFIGAARSYVEALRETLQKLSLVTQSVGSTGSAAVPVETTASDPPSS